MTIDNITNFEIRAVIDEYIHKERDREIMKRRLCDGICFEPLAEEFDLSATQVKNIVYRCQNMIFKRLKC